jgi:pimeloyl-ACP methyl ester carboxylesterase
LRPLISKIAVVLLAMIAGTLAGSLTAQAQIAFAPCRESNNFACGHLTVPLDPSGGTPGTLTLAMRRHRAPVEGPGSAVIPLAGGPGQAAIPLTEAFLELLGPIAATRDLLVFDQRGTGLSHSLSCRPSRRRRRAPRTLEQSILRCAQGLGAARAFYTTPDSVADIEAIRRAAGYEKLVLYGTSYGTKVAEQYAQAHPTHVEALVLDSVVTPNGPDPLSRSTFAAVPRVLRQLCARRECRHITRDPVSDLARVVARARGRAIAGHVVDNRGRPRSQPITSDALLGILLGGDFNPMLRAEFIPAVRATTAGDSAALARLLRRAESVSEEGPGGAVDAPLYLATTCEEEAFPWNRAASPSLRRRQAIQHVDALPASTFAPFTAGNALDLSGIGVCDVWPYATPAPPVTQAPLPKVPTLILSGESDLRTPTADAREVASQIPGSQLLVVPYAGHSVLTNEPTSCATDAMQAMFAGHAVHPCSPMPVPPVLKLPPLPPPRIGAVASSRGYRGLPGRTLHAVSLTFGDLSRQVLFALLESLSSGSLFKTPVLSGGGLRAGWYQLRERTIVLHGYSYVPGVTLSGTVTSSKVGLGIGGSAGAHGYLRRDRRGALVGALGGVAVRLAPSSANTPAIQASARAGAPPVSERRTSRLLAALGEALRRLPGSSVDLTELPYLLGSRRLQERWSPNPRLAEPRPRRAGG